MINTYIAKKKIEKAIIYELLKKDIVSFSQFNSIVKKLDNDIIKLKNNDKMNHVVVKIPI